MISGELNRVVVELLQQLLFWQERQKAQDPLKAAKKKRLVSGLRSELHPCRYSSHCACMQRVPLYEVLGQRLWCDMSRLQIVGFCSTLKLCDFHCHH